ncbi:MAG: 4-hydroxythreonine-4-phosphate dehydrogenase PdxA [Holophagales bacterium]|nr:4-hydroxythreonine-4-phosphate dehydrogenase PdxA [Holophagales bacterium]MYG29186.1 4-hydroxythreonine-4-phosphate dehydrogenase PdxA [Holophagales bacterium]MYI81244.1 4-hydroxythreonine-4-phosphate dehydrogenase PdxA [Holophagales bacterium]
MAVTMGDASGVGPEIAVRGFAEGLLGNDVLVYGDTSVLMRAADVLGLGVSIHSIDRPGVAVEGVLNVRDLRLLGAEQVTPGVLSREAGAAALAYVDRATRDALAGKVAGVVTLPMNKEATRMSRPDFQGHTEFIARLCGVRDFAMMLTVPELAVTHVSAHVSLREAIERVEPVRIRKVIDLTHDALSPFIESPRIAVCGLNPHAGEHGLFGAEDEEIIRPTIKRAAADGLEVSGPHPADTVFRQAIHLDRYDAVVCMYHDQGHAPMKLYGFERGVNVTIGLPIIRTSVDHGTAFDIAWQGKAFTDSLGHALDYAWKLAG